jgi:hypothetical protein
MTDPQPLYVADNYIGEAPVFKEPSDKYLKAEPRPDYFVNIYPDPTVMASTRSAATANTGNEPPVIIPMDGAGVSFKSEFTDRQPDKIEEQIKYVAENLLPKDYFQAALDHNRMGHGYVTTYHADKPFQGIQLLREEIRVPPTITGDSMFFGVPYVGPYNNAPTYFPNTDQIQDPRYVAPITSLASLSTSLRLPIAQEIGGPAPVSGAPATSVATRKLD